MASVWAAARKIEIETDRQTERDRQRGSGGENVCVYMYVCVNG